MLQIFIAVFLVALPLITILTYPNYMNLVGISVLVISLAIAIQAIIQKHKQTENRRAKINKDILIFLATFLLISFLGGLAGLFTNFYISNLFGVTTGFICAMLAGLLIGYFVRKSITKIITLKA